MAIQFYDEGEARDRRLQMLLQSAQTIQQHQLAKEENELRRQQLAQQDPMQSMYARSELATQNRLRVAQAKYYEGGGKRGTMSASRLNAKDKRTEEVINTLYENQEQRELVGDAFKSLENLKTGLGGKIERGFSKRLAADDPLLGDYQKVKMVLTNAQLRESLMLKGAISDVENKWLADAAANDDLLSTPRATEVFNKVIKGLETTDAKKIASYKKLYGEDPSEWDEVKGIRTKKETGIDLKKVNEIAAAAGIDLGGRKIVKAYWEKKK